MSAPTPDTRRDHACSGRDNDAMKTKAGIERAVVDVLRKLGFLEGAPKGRPPRSPDTAAPEDLRRFQLHQTQIGVRPPSIASESATTRPASLCPACDRRGISLLGGGQVSLVL
jgi:hypothetical protein